MTPCNAPAFRHALVIGAAGRVGRLLARHLAAEADHLALCDLVAGGDVAGCDVLSPSGAFLDLLGGADLTVLCLPQKVLNSSLAGLLEAVPAGATVIETSSVKMPIAAAVESARRDVDVLGINPLFGPDLGFAGHGVAVVPYRRASTRWARCWTERQGATAVLFDPEQHDRVMAAFQVACHAVILGFGDLLQTLGLADEAMDAAPPPARVLLLLLARVLSGETDLYWDIQTENPFGSEMRSALRTSLDRMSRLVEAGERQGFVLLLESMRSLLRPQLSGRSATLLNSI